MKWPRYSISGVWLILPASLLATFRQPRNPQQRAAGWAADRMERTTPGPNRSWPGETTPSDKEAPDPLALTGPLGISLLPCLADLLLPGRRYRAAVEIPAMSSPTRIPGRFSLTTRSPDPYEARAPAGSSGRGLWRS